MESIPLSESGVPWWRRLPWCTSALVLVYAVLYLALAPPDSPGFDALALELGGDGDGALKGVPQTRQVWRWYTYSLVHGSALHIAVNAVCTLAYGALIEMNCEAARTLAIHALSVLGGAFAFGWEGRVRGVGPGQGGDGLTLVGASPGMYGLLAAQLANLVLNWAAMAWAQRALYLVVLVGATATDVAVDVALYDPEVSYSSHAGGFAFGALAGLCFMFNVDHRAKAWERGVTVGAGAAAGALGLASAINLLTLPR